MNHLKNITVQIVLYEETAETIIKCLNNLKKFKVIILDNSNNHKLKNDLIKKYEIQKYILEKKNIGYSKAHNKIASFVDTDYLLILNPDCLIDEKNIINLYHAHKNYSNCGIVGPTTFNQNNDLTFNGGFLPENGNIGEPTILDGDTCFQSILGSAMLLRKKDFLDLGMFNEKLFLFFSDYDLCRKFRNIKKSVIQVFDSKAVHEHGISKVRNIFKRIFLREFYIIYDELLYFSISRSHQKKFDTLKKKIPSYYIKFFINLIFLNFRKSLLYASKIMAYNRFKKEL